VLAATVAGFIGAFALATRDAQRDAARRADIAAAEIRGSIEQADDTVEGIRRFMAGHATPGLENAQFVDVGARWISPVGLPAAAWIERVRASERAKYERRIGRAIVAPASSGTMAPSGRRASYLPATFVTGAPPLSEPGIDLGSEPGIEAAIARAPGRTRVVATPLGKLPDGRSGVFFVRSARLVDHGSSRRGFAVVLVPATFLLRAVRASAPGQRLQLKVGGASAGDPLDGKLVSSTFSAAGQKFEVLVKRGSITGAATLLPWVILVTGLLLSSLVARLALNAERRARAERRSRAELAASRARVVATADETRRRIERDLHDGAQQRLVHAVISLKLARRALGDADADAQKLVDEALGHAQQATDDLRELAHGILPSSLGSGLRPAIDTVVSRMRLPVSADVTPERFSQAVEATAYFIVAESLTNVSKHANARRAAVKAVVDGDALRVEVSDDGRGGAAAVGGTGLMGLQDRAAALNGTLLVESPAGGGTVVTATLPVMRAVHADQIVAVDTQRS
jgi:signal transduction histidine kinase